jgi:hypothetical protein
MPTWSPTANTATVPAPVMNAEACFMGSSLCIQPRRERFALTACKRLRCKWLDQLH